MYKIWGSHGSENVIVLGCDAMWTPVDTNILEKHTVTIFKPEVGVFGSG
jgi:hypothetical protein